MKKVVVILHSLSKLSKENIGILSILVLNLLLRIPRVSGILGDDAFVALWMGWTINSGDISTWTITIFAPFGMYPFAAYPIGLPLIIAGMLGIGFSYESLVFTLSMIFCAVGVFGSYELGQEMFSEKEMALFFAAVFSLSSVFIRFTYFTMSPRGPFLALLPWLLAYAIKYVRSRQKKDAIIASMVLLALVLTHGLALFLFIYFTVWLGYIILSYGSPILNNAVSKIVNTETIQAIKLQKITQWVLFFGLSIVSFFLGLEFLALDVRKTIEFLMSNDTVIGIIVNLITDYGLRIGIASLLLPVGIIAAFRNDFDNKRKWVHFTLLPILAFTIPRSLYASVLFLPVLAYYSVYGFQIVWKSDYRLMLVLGLLAFGAMYGFAYHIYVVALTPLAIIGSTLSGLGFLCLILYKTLTKLSVVKPRISSRHLWTLVILSMVSFTIVTTDGLISQNDSSYMSDDESSIIEYLLAQDETGIIFTYESIIARRLQAYGLIGINSNNDQIGLQAGWITPEEIIESTPLKFDLLKFLQTGSVFQYNGTYPEDEMWNNLLSLELTNTTEHEYAVSYGLRYVIVEKLETSYNTVVYTSDRQIYSPLLASAPLTCEPVFEGTSMVLFRLYT